jgi:glycosyltransferase involved in cell wall biosynthesis
MLVDLVDVLLQLLDAERIHASIVVVNDGSSTPTANVFSQLAQRRCVTVLPHAINLGKGAALKTGINYILTHEPNVMGIVTADADGQHLPRDILAVAKRLRECRDALILGCRDFGAETPLRSRFGNLLTRAVFRFLTRKRLVDTQTGLRGLPPSVAKRMLQMSHPGYELELALLYSEARRGTPIQQVEIATVYEPGNPTSHFNPVLDSLRIYFVFFRYSALSIAAAIVDYTLFFLLYYSTDQLLLSVVVGRLLIGGFYFTVARQKVFLSQGRITREAALFTLLLAASALASYGVITVLVLVFFVPVPLAKVLADLMLFFANFAFQKVFVFFREE